MVFNDSRMSMAAVRDPEAGHEVEILLAFDVVEVKPLPRSKPTG